MKIVTELINFRVLLLFFWLFHNFILDKVVDIYLVV